MKYACPLCNQELKEEEDNTLLYCVNPTCDVVGLQLYTREDHIVKRDRSYDIE
jgi:NAD-dependent DNA ligase